MRRTEKEAGGFLILTIFSDGSQLPIFDSRWVYRAAQTQRSQNDAATDSVSSVTSVTPAYVLKHCGTIKCRL